VRILVREFVLKQRKLEEIRGLTPCIKQPTFAAGCLRLTFCGKAEDRILVSALRTHIRGGKLLLGCYGKLPAISPQQASGDIPPAIHVL